MITLINKKLFKLKKTESDRDTFFKTNVLTAMKVKKSKKSDDMAQTVITTIKSKSEDYNASNTSVHSFSTHNGKRVATLFSTDEKNDSDIYLVAIPFNGFAEPMVESKEYRIHQGIIVQSDKRNIEFEGALYKKVLYLVVEPNTALFNPDHKYHVDEISLIFSSYNLETTNNDVALITTTMKRTSYVAFKQDGFTYRETVDESDPVNPEDFKGKQVFPIYTKEKKAERKSFNNKRQDENNKKSSGDKFEKMIDSFNKESNDNFKQINRKNIRKGKRR